MKEGLPVLKEMTDTQRRVFIDAVQCFENYLEAFYNSNSYRGNALEEVKRTSIPVSFHGSLRTRYEPGAEIP